MAEGISRREFLGLFAGGLAAGALVKTGYDAMNPGPAGGAPCPTPGAEQGAGAGGAATEGTGAANATFTPEAQGDATLTPAGELGVNHQRENVPEGRPNLPVEATATDQPRLTSEDLFWNKSPYQLHPKESGWTELHPLTPQQDNMAKQRMGAVEVRLYPDGWSQLPEELKNNPNVVLIGRTDQSTPNVNFGHSEEFTTPSGVRVTIEAWHKSAVNRILRVVQGSANDAWIIPKNGFAAIILNPQ